jgi:hypothetical protein
VLDLCKEGRLRLTDRNQQRAGIVAQFALAATIGAFTVTLITGILKLGTLYGGVSMEHQQLFRENQQVLHQNQQILQELQRITQELHQLAGEKRQ